MRINISFLSLKKQIGLFGGLILFFLIIIFGNLEPGHPEVTNTLAVALLMAIWWITEIVPLAVTALIPVILFPLLGVMDGKDVSSTYFNHVIFLFIGGFIVAIAMQKWNLHRRIALKILMYTGISPARILLGFMLSTAFLSMWISNTATTMMMVPILLSIIQKLEENIEQQKLGKYATGLFLGVAYSASIGGVSTLVGTPPNLSFTRIFQIMFPAAPEITFANWIAFALPISFILFLVAWLYLYFIYKPKEKTLSSIDKSTFKNEYKNLDPISFEERVILIDFIALAFLWIFRSDISIGSFKIPGWSNIFSNPAFLNDGTVAITMAVLLYFIPSKKKNKKLMDWEASKGIPWHIVLLFGGGFALASGFKESGLSMWFGGQLAGIASIHPVLIIFVIAIMMTFLTELTSNVATVEMLLPVLAGLSVSTEINPLLFMIPATLSASMAFMLPVATPPNAIIFGTGKISIMDMARTGIALNIIGAIVITLITYFLGSYIFGIDANVFPSWAN